MIELLVKYAHEQGLITEPGFAPKNIRWAIVLDDEGRFLDIEELGDADARRNPGLRFEKCPEFSQPEMVKGGIRRSHFLAETANVVALYGKGADDKKIRDKHGYFVDLLRQASDVMPELGKAAEVLSDEDSLKAIRSRLEDLKVRETDKVTLRISGTFPLEKDIWHDWWRDFRRTLAAKEEADVQQMPCLATGKPVQPALTHPKIKGLADVGGNTQGDVLIGFDKDAFRSYGLEQSANAAVSEEAASAYRAALNHLINNNSQRIAGVRIIHWFKGKVVREDDPLVWLEEGQGEQELQAQELARKLLTSIQSGQRPELHGNYFYALTLSGASGRVMVRDWIEGQFESLVANIERWFDDLSIVRSDGNTLAKSPKFHDVLDAMVRNRDDLSPPLVARLWRVAVTGEPIPRSVLANSLARTRVDIIEDKLFNHARMGIIHARMGIIKAYHLRKYRLGGGSVMAEALKPEMDEGHPNPAYQCGRLMAVLARLQRRALGDVGAGIVQRYYAAASTTPSLVLGRLTRNSQFHLNKLEPRLAHWFEDKLVDIWGNLKTGIPRTLDLEEQSLFALGYYQQIADMRKKKGDETDTDEEVYHE